MRELAERVARRLAEAPREQESGGGGSRSVEDLAALRAGLHEIQRRLAHIESHITHGDDCGHDGADASRRPPDARRSPSATSAAAQSPSQPQPRQTWLSGTYVPATSHPSQEQFVGLGEAVSELVEFFESEKTCTVEPGGKTCDHCGMCSARGF